MIKKYVFIIAIMSAFIACGGSGNNNGDKDKNASNKKVCLPGQLCVSP